MKHKTQRTGGFSMRQKNELPYLTSFFLIVILVLLPVTALAQSSWSWKMSLRVDEVGDSMYMPSAVAFDEESERYYAVDTGRSRLVSFGRDGRLVRAFTANEQLKAPFDMVRLGNGKLWVVEKGRNSLTLIDIAAKKVKPNILRDGERLVFPLDCVAKVVALDGDGFILRKTTQAIAVCREYFDADLTVRSVGIERQIRATGQIE